MKVSLFTAVAVVTLLTPRFINAATRPELASKPAWQWTSADRIAARFDRTKIRERVLRAESAQPLSSQTLSHASNGVAPHFADVIDGREHPELFFPH
ncbi:MAG TPA: hypothetical protein VJ901_02600, partial [Thermoanaerobaculia bacterium]|nr:hypothetical protein [Thermoanaerobaculia bacterium]